jgi:hypothetical protein
LHVAGCAGWLASVLAGAVGMGYTAPSQGCQRIVAVTRVVMTRVW